MTVLMNMQTKPDKRTDPDLSVAGDEYAIQPTQTNRFISAAADEYEGCWLKSSLAWWEDVMRMMVQPSWRQMQSTIRFKDKMFKSEIQSKTRWITLTLALGHLHPSKFYINPGPEPNLGSIHSHFLSKLICTRVSGSVIQHIGKNILSG